MQALTFSNLKEAFLFSSNKFADKPFLNNDQGLSITYSEAKRLALNLAEKIRETGIGKNDKVVILSENNPFWPIAYFAIILSDATAVPILPDFTSDEVSLLTNHSEAKGIIVSTKQLSKIDKTAPLSIFEITESAIVKLTSLVEKKTVEKQVLPSDIASIIYTSGTTGTPKGVMLTHDNFIHNTSGCFTVQDINIDDVFLSVLPLAHAYEFTIGLLLPMVAGSTIHYLSKPPTASTLIPAMAEIRPTTMLTVPLIMEKIFKNGIKPKLTDSRLKRTLYSTILGRKLMHRLAGKELKQKFGGRIRFFGVGGAKLDGKTEQFLKEAKFPYSIGYGMTEAAPLIAGSPPRETKLFSTGKVVQNQEIKISNPDPKTGIGEIWARGRNIMKGYYKLPELTKELISPDGWLKTGDLGKLQPNGYLYICGRLKNIILGPNGENIYPEDIEAILNRHQLVMDSLVYELKGKLIAKVNLNQQEFEQKYQEMKMAAANFQQEMERKVDEVLAELQAYVNNQVNRSSRLSFVLIQSEPFEKTPTQKIKRYLYI